LFASRRTVIIVIVVVARRAVAFAIVVAPFSSSSSALAIIVEFVARREFAIVVDFVACRAVAIIVNFVARRRLSPSSESSHPVARRAVTIVVPLSGMLLSLFSSMPYFIYLYKSQHSAVAMEW